MKLRAIIYATCCLCVALLFVVIKALPSFAWLLVPSIAAVVAILMTILAVLRVHDFRKNSDRLKREHRLRWGMCPECGYNLRGSPLRCPECGTQIPPEKNAYAN